MTLGWLIVIFCFLVIFVIAGYIYLLANRDDLSFYGHLFKWFGLPVTMLVWAIFVPKSKKGPYMTRLREDLFIKSKKPQS